MLQWITRLVLLLVLGVLAPGEAAASAPVRVWPPAASAEKLASWGEHPEAAVLRQAATMQAAETQQAASSLGYDFASGRLLAAEKLPGSVGRYADVGGHHVHAKAGLRGHATYDPKQGFSISQEFMEARGWNHQDMTSMQRRLFDDLAASGRANTLPEHTRIAVEALQAGGATRAEARSLAAQSLWDLRSQGVRAPTRIPWNQ